MGNASQKVKLHADAICDTNENDGVVKFLKKVIL